ALTDDVAELVTQLRDRAARARTLETRIAAIRRAPDEDDRTAAKAEAAVREGLGDVRSDILSRADARTLFLRLFPEGIRFYPSRVEKTQVWEIAGAVDFRNLVASDQVPMCTLESDPKGT